jgi:hypothetical protein
MTRIGRIAVLAVSLLVAGIGVANAAKCMAHWTCSGSQCAAVMGGYSGDSGPFGSQSECQAWGAQYNQSATCTCDDASASSATGNMSLPTSGLTAQQTAGMAIGVVGLEMLFAGIEAESQRDAQAAAQAQAQAQILAEQQAEAQRIQAQKDEEAKRRLLGEMKGVDTTDLSLKGIGDDSDLKLKTGDEMASLAPKPAQLTPVPDADPKKSPRTAAFLKGKKDASDCLSQNAGGYCVGLSPADTMTCTNDYHGGYAYGERAAKDVLFLTWKLGVADRQAKRKYNGLATGVGGTCGVHAVEAYSSGFFDKPFTTIGR